MKINKYIRTILITVVSIVVVAGITYAGSLAPTTGNISSQSYTLTDIYRRLTTNIPASVGNHTLSTTTANPQASSYTLTQIYNAIPTIDPTKVLQGTTYLGVAGTATTSGTSAELVWSDQFKLNPLNGLCWNNQNCSVFNGGLYNYNGHNLGAVEYCSYLVSADGLTIADTPQNIWRLPTKAELLTAMSVYIASGHNGEPFPLSSNFSPLTLSTNVRVYWTSELDPSQPLNAFVVSSNDGSGATISSSRKYTNWQVRCVR